MSTQKWKDELFGMKVREEREKRHWSQPEMAKKLAGKGWKELHASTIAKIEAGNRSVRINEAVAFADVFGVPLYALLGRLGETPEDDLKLSLRALRDVCSKTALSVYQAHKALMDVIRDLPDVDGYDDEVSHIEDITAQLDGAHEDLHDVAEKISQRLGTEQTPEVDR